LRIITVNVNGIRSAARKRFFTWLSRQRADLVCLQEVRAQRVQLSDPVFHPRSFHCHYYAAERPGYSGVALFSRMEPDGVIEGLGWPDMDPEARFLEAHFGRLSVISLYLPSGSSGDHRQEVKMDFLERFAGRLAQWRRNGRDYVICGDFNFAHKNIDIRNWRSNQKNSGFLPEERAWMDTLFNELGYVDAFRVVNSKPDQYTWWSNRGNARANNVGWRIDYQVVSNSLAGSVRRARIYTGKNFSDHAPLIMDYDPRIR